MLKQWRELLRLKILIKIYKRSFEFPQAIPSIPGAFDRLMQLPEYFRMISSSKPVPRSVNQAVRLLVSGVEIHDDIIFAKLELGSRWVFFRI